MQRNYPKSTKKVLRHLAGVAYQRDLDSELTKLKARFDQWQSGKIDCFDLSDLIHTFHNGTSRELWKFYTHADPDRIVARGIIDKIISREEVDDDVLAQIRPLLELYEQEDAQEHSESEDSENELLNPRIPAFTTERALSPSNMLPGLTGQLM